MKTSPKPLDVIWEHVPRHKGIPGNEMADKLAGDGIEVLPFTKNKGEEIPSEQMIADVLPQPLDSEGSDETDKHISKKHQPKNKLREDLQKSFSKLDKAIENRGLKSPNILHESLWCGHEDMQNDCRPSCTYVYEVEEDHELLENLKALDPCRNYDDVEFSNRVKNFLEKYERGMCKEACTPHDWEYKPSSYTSPAIISGEPRTNRQTTKSTEFSDKNSREARKSMVRFKDAPEEIESSSEPLIIEKQPPPPEDSCLRYQRPRQRQEPDQRPSQGQLST